VKPHDLRHLSNTLAAKVPGITLKDLKARMGHKSDQAALRYMHATNDADAVMASGLDTAIRKAQEASGDDAADAG
jgi:integrase